jgi:hypothetical protein
MLARILAAFVAMVCFHQAMADKPIDFNRDIRPILSSQCFLCHGPDESSREADLRLDLRDEAIKQIDDHAAINLQNPEASELLARITSDDDSLRMPPTDKGRKLDAKEIDLLKRWIAEGATYATHWSYTAPQRPTLPTTLRNDWSKNDIDRFILSAQESKGMQPSPEADPITLARRAAITINGLPPTKQEVDVFIADQSPDAYESFVDVQLSKPSYGERWARVWLDLARYADSCGYADDPLRTMWPYRDYVINAFNSNMPFDQFTIEQIAGDLLENPTEDQIIATAFHRNTMTNNEGGTNDEQFRNEAIVDRVNTTMAVWMGSTFACAQCHTHKYDPITQKEYFQVFDIFNQTEDADRKDESPVLSMWNDEERASRETYESTIRTLDDLIAKHKDGGDFAESLKASKTKATDELNKLTATKTVPIMRELGSDKRRSTFVQLRGNYQSLGEQVEPGVPAVFPSLQSDAPKNRLSLAKWLVSRDNPLTARVVVNRHWEQVFGNGIVETCEEFGSQGDLPTHPELLDWLSVELMENGWDMKKLLKLMVMSATFRQSTAVSNDQLEADASNRWYARGPRFRISAEMVRDITLASSGLLSSKMSGPPVQPPQPELGLTAAFGSKTDWKTSDGEDRYRRGIYTLWRRSNPYPSMATFDAPNREVCTLRRSRTNTPLQALVTLNDPVYLEAAQSLARRSMNSDDASMQIKSMFEAALIRSPTDEELKRLVELHQSLHNDFAVDHEAAKKMAEEPLGPLQEGQEVTQAATLTVIANVIMNLDEFLMPR